MFQLLRAVVRGSRAGNSPRFAAGDDAHYTNHSVVVTQCRVPIPRLDGLLGPTFVPLSCAVRVQQYSGSSCVAGSRNPLAMRFALRLPV